MAKVNKRSDNETSNSNTLIPRGQIRGGKCVVFSLNEK